MHQTWGRTIGTILFVFNWAVKKTGYSIYIGVYTTQVYRDYNKPLQGSLLNNQYFMKCQQGLVHVAQVIVFLILLQSKGQWVYSLKSYKTVEPLRWWRTVPEKMIRPLAGKKNIAEKNKSDNTWEVSPYFRPGGCWGYSDRLLIYWLFCI